MTVLTYTNPVRPGAPEDVRQVNDCFAQAATVINGQLGDANVARRSLAVSHQATPSMQVYQRLWGASSLMKTQSGMPIKPQWLLRDGGFAPVPALGQGCAGVSLWLPRAAEYYMAPRRAAVRLGVCMSSCGADTQSRWRVELCRAGPAHGVMPGEFVLDVGTPWLGVDFPLMAPSTWAFTMRSDFVFWDVSHGASAYEDGVPYLVAVRALDPVGSVYIPWQILAQAWVEVSWF